MHNSKVIRKLKTHTPIFCAKTHLCDPSVVEIFGYCGFDCVWIDMEHTPVNFESALNQVRAAKMTGMDSMVRVPRGCYSDFIRPLEMDATGLMVPHVFSPEETEQAVRWSFFKPKGQRPIDAGNNDGHFCMLELRDYVRYCNEEKFLMLQIEDKEAVDRIDEITEVKGVDIFYLGTLDLTQSYGTPGEFNNPEYVAGRDRVIETLRKKKLPWGIPCKTEDISRYYAMGCVFFVLGSDTTAVAQVFKDKLAKATSMVGTV